MRTLHQALSDYLTLRRGLGFKLQSDGVRLQNFLSFLEEKNATYITMRLATEWALRTRGAQPGKRLRMVRGFAKYTAAFDSRTEVPPANLIPVKAIRPRPYIYSDEEVRCLLDAARAYDTGKPQGTYYCLFGLLIVAGLRVGEAMRLRVDDVDLENGILTIRDTKFAQSRLVPLHPTAVRELKNYKSRRDALFSAHLLSHFFITAKGTPLYHESVYRVFRPLLLKISLRKTVTGSGPRLHDFRHRFAVQTMIDWYRSGEEVERRVPILSTFLGHASVDSTYWYLTEYPELMQMAVQRLEARWEGRQ